MNANRESELRRKLTAPVPPPPAGLADRIKQDIPEDLFPAKGGTRPGRTRFFPLQVAASLVVLAGSAWMATRVLIAPEPRPVRTAAYEKAAPPPVVATADGVTAEPPVIAVQPPASQVAELSEPSPVSTLTSREQAAFAPEVRAESREREESASNSEPVMQMADASVAAAAPAAAPPPPPPAVAAPMPHPASAPEAVAEAESSRVVAQRSAASMKADISAGAATNAAQPSTIFGFSVDSAAISQIRRSIDRGESPARSAINGEAFVSYFAGRNSSRAAVSLDAEGSTSPAGKSPGDVLLRFTVDTAADGPQRSAVARDAAIKVELNSRIVTKYRSVGGAKRLSASEPTLFDDSSVSAVYELTLKPMARPQDHVATIRLTWREAGTGRARSHVKTLTVRDLTRDWENASRRHRLATLGGLLGESMQRRTDDERLAQRAEELATQEPKDERAQELAEIARTL